MDSTMIHTLRQAAALRRKWSEMRQPSLLGWLTSNDPAIAEVAVEWGYDGLIIDTEHSTFDPPTLRQVLMAFRGTGCVPIVRVSANDIYLIKTAFDLGAGGVLIPLVDDAAAARAAALLSKEVIEEKAHLAYVIKRLCCGCGLCVTACPYQARMLNEEEGKAEVIGSLCQGCASCVIACRNGASQQRNFEKDLNLAALDAVID